LKIGILEAVGQFRTIFWIEGDVPQTPTNHFCMDRWPYECLFTLSLTVYTQRNFVADFLPEKECILAGKIAAFLQRKKWESNWDWNCQIGFSIEWSAAGSV